MQYYLICSNFYRPHTKYGVEGNVLTSVCHYVHTRSAFGGGMGVLPLEGGGLRGGGLSMVGVHPTGILVLQGV